ncbi:hypothetical protein ACHRVZ_01290 [Flavobacterium sp. FlaQc-57]|uniref:hypothetical protein n=1 Tax=Flavobacterium sp. FlaQc-57 TaxID=3374186 RepID=UPI003757A37E
MKKIILFFFLLLHIETAFPQVSAFQKIAIPATNFELSTIYKIKVIPSSVLILIELHQK